MPDSLKSKFESIATEIKHLFKVKRPDFKAKWAREWVIPENVLQAADAKAEMQVDSTYPEDRPSADIAVALSGDIFDVSGLNIPPLKLAAKKVVKANGARPVIQFGLKHGIWEKYDKLDYHFTATIDNTDRKTEKALKVKRWHVQAVDKNPAEATAQLPFRNQESANFLSSYAGAANDVANSHAFVAHNTSKSLFGSWLQNAFSAVYTGHGCVICGVCGQPYDSSNGTGSDADFGRWTTCPTDASHSRPVSTYCIGNWAACVSDATKPMEVSFFHADHVGNESVLPSAPRYLMFSVACGGAFETSLYDAFVGRGTRYGIGFEKSTRCDWARDYAKSFFDTWVKTHKCDPDKIPDVFNGLQSTWEAKLQPVLFGRWAGLGSHARNLGRAIRDAF